MNRPSGDTLICKECLVCRNILKYLDTFLYCASPKAYMANHWICDIWFVIWKSFWNLVIYDKLLCNLIKQTHGNPKSIKRTWIFFLHICLLTHEQVCGGTYVLIWKWMAYVSILIHVYISFLLKPVCMTTVSLDHLCTLHMIVPVSLLS